jgi:drug/metabolite transporter (DMT)-like permease
LLIGGVVALKEGIVLPNAEDLGRILLCGCVGVSATQLLFIYGLRATTATNAACIEPLIPCVVFVLATVFKMEPASCSRKFLFRIFGVVVGCAGAMVTTLGHGRAQVRLQGVGTVPRLGNHLPKIAGDAAILLQCFTLAMYLLLTRTLAKKYSAMWLTAYCMFAGALFTSFVTLLSLVASGGEWPGWDRWHFDETFYVEEIYASLIASVQNYALRMWAIQYLPATTISMYFCVDPPATALFAAIFLHEQIHTTQVIGSTLILFGMWVTIRHGEEGEELGGREFIEDEAHVGSINASAAANHLKFEEHGEFGGEEAQYDVDETISLLTHKSD